MERFQSILVATDFSVHGNHAVRTAARLAEHNAARLVLLHVASPAGFKPLRQWFGPSLDVDLKTAQARATLRRFAVEITGRHGVPVRHRVVLGDPFGEILHASEAADLLVLGRRGTSRLKDLVIGGAAERLLRQCRCPVLVVKQPSEGYRRVLVPVDFTVHSQASLEAAAAVAPRADVHVLHVLGAGRRAEIPSADATEAVVRDPGELEHADAQGRIEALIAAAGLDRDQMPHARIRYRGSAVGADGSTRSRSAQERADLAPVAGKQEAPTIEPTVSRWAASRGALVTPASRSDVLDHSPRGSGLRAGHTWRAPPTALRPPRYRRRRAAPGGRRARGVWSPGSGTGTGRFAGAFRSIP
jgi:nucleotide-binding universal stress UspA family protein